MKKIMKTMILILVILITLNGVSKIISARNVNDQSKNTIVIKDPIYSIDPDGES